MGRAAERDAALAAYGRAAGGLAQLLLITGEPGIGKTRLVGELTEAAGLDPDHPGPDGAQLRIGECVPLAGTTLAYGPFVAALRDQAAPMLAGDTPGDQLAARQRVFERVAALVSGLSAPAPLVLVLEDLHWADETSLQLLAFLAVRLRTERVLIIGTLREEDLSQEAAQWLAALQRRRGVTRLRLTGLTGDEISALVSGLAPAGADPVQLAAVVAAAGRQLGEVYARELRGSGPNWPQASLAEAILARAAERDPGRPRRD